MKAYLIMDKEFKTKNYDEIYSSVKNFLSGREIEVEEKHIGREDLEFCMGCFGCWVKKPGECVINDSVAQINHDFINSDLVVYLCPVVFGQFSANMKNVLDRWIPNVLPFFERRKNGSTSHPARYLSYPRQVVIAYADNLSKEDASLFRDIIYKHRNSVDLIIYQGSQEELYMNLEKIELKKVGAVL